MEVAGISLSALAGVQGCPFQGPFYQLMRQFLLAAYLRETGTADDVEVASIGFSRNTKLNKVPQQLDSLTEGKGDCLINAWNAVVQGVPPLRHWTVEQLMAPVHRVEGIDIGWRNYLRERYDV
jgi:hypothetical protein